MPQILPNQLPPAFALLVRELGFVYDTEAQCYANEEERWLLWINTTALDLMRVRVISGTSSKIITPYNLLRDMAVDQFKRYLLLYDFPVDRVLRQRRLRALLED